MFYPEIWEQLLKLNTNGEHCQTKKSVSVLNQGDKDYNRESTINET